MSGEDNADRQRSIRKPIKSDSKSWSEHKSEMIYVILISDIPGLQILNGGSESLLAPIMDFRLTAITIPVGETRIKTNITELMTEFNFVIEAPPKTPHGRCSATELGRAPSQFTPAEIKLRTILLQPTSGFRSGKPRKLYVMRVPCIE